MQSYIQQGSLCVCVCVKDEIQSEIILIPSDIYNKILRYTNINNSDTFLIFNHPPNNILSSSLVLLDLMTSDLQNSLTLTPSPFP